MARLWGPSINRVWQVTARVCFGPLCRHQPFLRFLLKGATRHAGAHRWSEGQLGLPRKVPLSQAQLSFSSVPVVPPTHTSQRLSPPLSATAGYPHGAAT